MAQKEGATEVLAEIDFEKQQVNRKLYQKPPLISEQQRRILNEKGERIADALMEKMTPLILQRSNAE